MDRRVVITGIGGLCGLGTNAPSIWKEMREGRSAIGPIVNSELHGLTGTIGAEIMTLPEHDIDRRQLVTMDRFSLLAVLAAREAMRQAGLPCDERMPIASVRQWASAAAAGKRSRQATALSF